MKTNKQTNNKGVRTNKPIKKTKRTKRRVRQQRRINRMPAAYAKGTPKTFNTITMNGTTAVIEGSDLIYKIPDSLTANSSTNVITIIPANPAYWTGTRIAAIAAGYQNYRPINFTVHYVPQCAVTQQGNVIAGTLWNEVPTAENLQQTLKTSNGGILTQCYKPATSVIRMKSNLQFNLFRMGGNIDQQSNPFIYIAMQIGCVNSNNQPIIPGYFYIKYRYVFKNPIGTGVTYANSGLTTTSGKTFYANAVCYALQTTTLNSVPLEIGSRIDIEKADTGYEYYYNGTKLTNTLTIPVWVLQNQPITQLNRLAIETMFKEPIDYSQILIIGQDHQIIVPYLSQITYESENYIVTVFNAGPDFDLTLPESVEYVYVIPTPADFGPVTQVDIFAETILFEAPKSKYFLHGDLTKFKIPLTKHVQHDNIILKTIRTSDGDILNIAVNNDNKSQSDIDLSPDQDKITA